MTGTHHRTTAARALLSSLAIVLALSLTPARAGGPASGDRCASPLPPELEFSGGATVVYTLRGSAGTLQFAQFGSNGLAGDLRLLGYRPLPNDAVGEFTLIRAGKAHIYGGPVHVFRRGTQQHVCRMGAIEVDTRGNTTQQSNPYRLNVTIDGILIGGQARAIVWIGGARYTYTGTRRTLLPA